MDKARLKDIKSRIKEVRGLLVELEDAAQDVKEKRQHAAVDHLEDYIDSSEMTEISMFRDEALSEIKELLEKLKRLVG